MNKRNSAAKYVLCVNNDEFPASLELRKIYNVIPNSNSTVQNLIRIIDESGEDYLYPKNLFVPIGLSRDLQKLVQNTN